MHHIHNIRKKNTLTKIKNIIFPDRFIEHMSPEEQYREISMDTDSIVNNIMKFYQSDNILQIDNFNSKN